MALTVLTVGPKEMLASPIPLGGGGVLNGSNAGVLVAVTTNAPCIAFSGATVCAVPPAVTPYDITGTDPIFQSGSGTGTIKDIGVTFPITSFKTANLTIGGGPAIFDLLNIIAPAGFPACNLGPGQAVCATNAFVLTQNSPTQVGISLATNEIGYLGNSGSGSTPYVGIFTSQLSGSLLPFGCVISGAQTCTATIQNMLIFESTAAQTTAAGLGAIGQSGTIRSTWSVTESPVTASVPEPTSFVLIGAGLLGLGVFAKRRKSVA